MLIWTLLVPAVTVLVPAVQVPPRPFGVAMTRPLGKVSVKLKVCVGLPAGCVTVKVMVWLPPMVRPPAKVLLRLGVAAVTVTQAPVVLVPLVALLVTEAVRLVGVPRLVLPLVLLACGQTPTVALAAVVTLTVMVQLVWALVIW